MDLRVYFAKVREVESTIETAFPIVTSLETPDGGRPGCVSEVARLVAARLIVDSRARIASSEEAQGYREEVQSAREEAARREAESKIAVVVQQADRYGVDLRGKGRHLKNQES